MSAIRYVCLLCDNCEEVESDISAPTVARVRAECSRLGWEYRNGQDLCPKCCGNTEPQS